MGCHAVETSSGKVALRFRWTQPDGRRRYFSVTTPYASRAEAMKKASVIGAEIRAGEFDPLRHFEPAEPRFGIRISLAGPLSSGATLDSEMEAWIARKERRGVRASRTRDYTSHLKNYIRPMLGALRADALSRAVLEDFQVWLVAEAGSDGDGVSEKTARNVIRGTLRAFVRDSGGDLRSFDALTWERYAPGRHQEPFSLEEQNRILRWFKRRRPVGEYVSLRLRFSGMRPSEVRGLQVGDFDRTAGSLAVSRSRHLGADDATKTVAAERIVELEADVAAEVATLCGIRDPNERILSVAEDTLRDNFTKAQTALGLRQRSLYQAKHTYAALALRAGESPSTVAVRLGVSLATLEKHYAASLRKRREAHGLHQGLHQDRRVHA